MSEAPTSPIPLASAGLGLTCGGCKYGCTVEKDLRQPLECRRFPPIVTQFIIGMTPQGPNIINSTTYPRVQRLGPACGEYVTKFATN